MVLMSKENFYLTWEGEYKHRDFGCDRMYGTRWHIDNAEFTIHAKYEGVVIDREPCPDCW